MNEKIPKKLLIVAAERDYQAAQELIAHLSLLRRQGLITLWHESTIDDFSNWHVEMERRVQEANIFLFLCSHGCEDDPNFQDLYRKAQARKYPTRESVITRIVFVPVYLDWDAVPLGLSAIQWTPRGAVINQRQDRDEGWVEVAQDIRQIVDPSSRRRPTLGRR